MPRRGRFSGHRGIDTRYSMLMHPDVSSKLGHFTRRHGARKRWRPFVTCTVTTSRSKGGASRSTRPTLQTRIFTINYPHAQRLGTTGTARCIGFAQYAHQSVGTSGATTPVPTSAAGSTGARHADHQRPNRGMKSSANQFAHRFWAELSGRRQGHAGVDRGAADCEPASGHHGSARAMLT